MWSMRLDTKKIKNPRKAKNPPVDGKYIFQTGLPENGGPFHVANDNPKTYTSSKKDKPDSFRYETLGRAQSVAKRQNLMYNGCMLS